MADRKIPVEIAPVVNTAESAAPGVPIPPSKPAVSLPAMRPGDPSLTIPAMKPAAPEKEERLPGSPPPDRTRR